MMTEFSIPDGGGYFDVGGHRYHIRTEGVRIIIRCVTGENGGTGRIYSHMPAGNEIVLEAINDSA